jgi:hypothetical protein
MVLDHSSCGVKKGLKIKAQRSVNAQLAGIKAIVLKTVLRYNARLNVRPLG